MTKARAPGSGTGRYQVDVAPGNRSGDHVSHSAALTSFLARGGDVAVQLRRKPEIPKREWVVTAVSPLDKVRQNCSVTL